MLHVRPFGACVADQAAGWPCGALRGGGARERPVGSVSGATLLGAGGPAGLPEEDGGGGRDRGLRGGGPHMGSTAEAERGGRRDPGGCGEKRRGRHWARPGGRSRDRAGVDVFLQGRAGVDAFLAFAVTGGGVSQVQSGQDRLRVSSRGFRARGDPRRRRGCRCLRNARGFTNPFGQRLELFFKGTVLRYF